MRYFTNSDAFECDILQFFSENAQVEKCPGFIDRLKSGHRSIRSSTGR